MLINSISDIYQDITYQPRDIETNPASADEIIKNGFLISFKEESGLKSVLKLIENFVYTKNYTVFGGENIAPTAVPGEKVMPTENEQVQESTGVAHTAVKQNLINVNLSKLDSLMDLMGEIVITESMCTGLI